VKSGGETELDSSCADERNVAGGSDLLNLLCDRVPVNWASTNNSENQHVKLLRAVLGWNIRRSDTLLGEFGISFERHANFRAPAESSSRASFFQ
jgi:hypothetical protein